jgi:hypothetical protein
VSAARILEQLHQAGFRLRPAPDGEHVLVSPLEALTDEVCALIRAHKPQLLAILRHDGTEPYRTAVRVGCLVLCQNCQAFRSRPDSHPDGWCRRYQVETWARWPFTCEGYEVTSQ